MSFSGSRIHQNYCDNEAPQTIDVVNHGGPRRVMPVFDGTGDIDVFFKKFESIKTACEWPGHETISRLMTDCLQGEAASILLTIPSDFIMTYTNVKKKLYTYFGNQKDSLVYQMKLREITGRWNESLQDFCERVAITANEAYPSPSNERERSGIFAIVRGCRSDMVTVNHAALTNTLKSDTIEKAVQLIWEMENRSKVYHMGYRTKWWSCCFWWIWWKAVSNAFVIRWFELEIVISTKFLQFGFFYTRSRDFEKLFSKEFWK